MAGLPVAQLFRNPKMRSPPHIIECARAQNLSKREARTKRRCSKAAAQQRGAGSCEPVARLLRRSEVGLAQARDRAAAGIGVERIKPDFLLRTLKRIAARVPPETCSPPIAIELYALEGALRALAVIEDEVAHGESVLYLCVGLLPAEMLVETGFRGFHRPACLLDGTDLAPMLFEEHEPRAWSWLEKARKSFSSSFPRSSSSTFFLSFTIS